MTIEVPPTAATTVVETPAKPDETRTEPTLSIQIEPPTANNESPEDLVTPNEEKPTSAKRRALFNNPFKAPKKEANTPDTPTAHTTDIPKEHAHAEEKAAVATATGVTSGTGENKISKGLGNLYTRIKQTASSHNIKDAAGTSPPPATTLSEHPIAEEKEAAAAAAAVKKKPTHSSSSSSSSSSEGGHAQAHEAETPSASVSHSNMNKRQSLLSKLFGGSGKKKEEEQAEADHTTREVTTPSHEAETNDSIPNATAVDPESEERPASPPLSRRVTGFFAKKIPSYNKKHPKSNDKAGEDHTAANATTDTTTTATAAAAAAAIHPQEPSEATTKEDAETTTNKDASPAPVTTSA
ncbi:Bifunctional purine biosynthesis protein PurH [Mucor velutinosus]|uniref:Bifunctional purine biosynthesis protein PurH n=1 Tax=Mucor velutinosus TaxID=708070 RepID=A0AAN7HL44_9FUNG|nr:Bifunctional purine biosynthesis protein PurH [Mucor velutinosus]